MAAFDDQVPVFGGGMAEPMGQVGHSPTSMTWGVMANVRGGGHRRSGGLGTVDDRARADDD